MPRLNPTDFPDLNWIWTAKTRNDQIVYLRDTFTLESVPSHAELTATADNHLELYLNGRKIADTFHKHHEVWQRVRRVKVASLLHPGVNVIAIRAKNDTASAGVLVSVKAGGNILCQSNGNWRVAYSVPNGTAWRGEQFNDSRWPLATVIAPYGAGPWGDSVDIHCGYLVHLYFQPLHVTVLHGKSSFHGLSTVSRALTPEDISVIRPEYEGRSLLAPARRIRLTEASSKSKNPPELLIGFGEEVAGRIQVRGSGGSVSIGTGESKSEALNAPWGGVHVLKLVDGKTESTPYSAFRYATVSFNGPGKINLNRLRLDFKYYPVKYRGAFACSDPLLTKIWYTGAYTAHLCMQEQIWDAPKRDRAMWMGDLQVSGQVIDNVFLARIIQGLAPDCGGGGRKCRVCRRLVSVAGLSSGAQSARATSIRFWVPMLHFTLSICRPV